MKLFFTNYQDMEKVSCIYKITCTKNGYFYIGSAISFRKRMKDHRNDLKKNKHSSSVMQNCFNKYGEDYFETEIIESFNRIIEYKSTDYKEVLLKTEEKYIQELKPEMNTQMFPYSSFGNFTGGIPVYQYDLEGNFIREWSSSREVERTLGFNPENGLRNQSAGGFQWSREKVDKMGKYKQKSGEYGQKECSLYDLWGNLIQTFSGVRLMAKHIWGENCNIRKCEQFLSFRMKNNNTRGFENKYRVAFGHEPKLNNDDNKQYEKKFIVVRYDIKDQNTPLDIWENLNIAEKNLNIKTRKQVINGEECYIQTHFIFKRL